MRSFLTSLAFIAGTYAQSSVYTDANTGITFQRYANTEGVSFGIAVPQTPASDFIGQMVAPNNGSGYAGVSLTPSMTGSLLVVAWPNNNSVVASLRETSGYTSPGVYTASGLSVSPIANGTFVNSTHLAYTFLCTGCMGLDLSFAGNSTSITLGWALGTKAVTNPSSASTASFAYHDGGSEILVLLYLAQPLRTTLRGLQWQPPMGLDLEAQPRTQLAPQRLLMSPPLCPIQPTTILLLELDGRDHCGRSTMAWNDTVTQYDVPSMAYYLTTASDTSEYCTDVASMAGCLLGGGTMVNALMFVRPQEADFNDKWPTGWKFTDVKASADKLYERNPGTTLSSVDRQRYDQSAWNILSPFFGSIGYKEVDAIQSPNEKTQVFSHPPWDIQDGLRAGPVKSYLPLAKAMSNFKLTLNTKVVRAIRNGSTISGVEVEDSTGSRQIINVNPGGNVILASGTMSTPRILYNSGIGPTDQITTVANGCTGVKLPSKADWINLPVGKNLRDHPIFTLTFNTTANATSMLSTDFLSPNTTDIDLFAKGSGPLAQSGQRLNFWTSMNTTNGTRFFQGTCNSPAAGQVRIKLYLTHGATSSGVLGITSDGATEFTTSPWMNTDADKTAVITLIDSLLAAARNSSSLTPSSTMSGASLVSNYITGDHFVGTAMMGTSNDGTAVVDTDTKVFGTDNLFVVDASIHPDLPTGNTQAIVMVVAEHAASKILALGSSASNSSRTAIPSKKSPCRSAPTAMSKRPSKRLYRF
ncbi:Cellobiose dehydrogenase [Lachnellula cervina]|uniref:Cellobiose dehydrogenase n=1 Tax=Lachnellula cervina TaxID=1316786 RepID=A0A7D8YUV2_9HELO|nr:Cellobiose dehydrogenase [Lachnellula cervina]